MPVGAVLFAARVAEGSSVLVLGAGGVGQFVVQGARIAGAERIVVADPVGSSMVVSGSSCRPDPESKQGELGLLFLRLFRSLDALMGGDEGKSRAWLRAENSHLGGVPAERIRRVEGLVDVIQYLDAMRGHL